MKRIQWWTLLGLSGAGLAALVLGEVVRGQPDPKVPSAKEPAPFVVPRATGVPSVPELPKGKSVADPVPMPSVGPITQPIDMIPSLPAPVSAQGQKPEEKTLSVPPQSLPLLPSFSAQKSDGKVPLPPSLPLPGLPSQPEPVRPVLPGNAPSKSTVSNVAMDVAPGKQQAAVTIEWVGASTIRINQPLACQIIVRNTSTTPVQNVIVRHRLGQGVTCKASEPAAANDLGELVWNLGQGQRLL